MPTWCLPVIQTIAAPAIFGRRRARLRRQRSGRVRKYSACRHNATWHAVQADTSNRKLNQIKADLLGKVCRVVTC